jgi:hypothetical protein
MKGEPLPTKGVKSGNSPVAVIHLSLRNSFHQHVPAKATCPALWQGAQWCPGARVDELPCTRSPSTVPEALRQEVRG